MSNNLCQISFWFYNFLFASFVLYAIYWEFSKKICQNIAWNWWNWVVRIQNFIKFIWISLIDESLSFFLISTEITHRFQTARPEIRSLLLQCLLPWLENMELVAANVTPATPLSYIMVKYSHRIWDDFACMTGACSFFSH